MAGLLVFFVGRGLMRKGYHHVVPVPECEI